MRLAHCTAAALLCVAVIPAAADPLPESLLPGLSGPVVDQPNALEAETEVAISNWLGSYQKRTGERVLVVILDDLKGHTIEDWRAGLLKHAADHEAPTAVLTVVPKRKQSVLDATDALKAKLPPEIAARIVASELTEYDAAHLQGNVLRAVTDILEQLTEGQVSSSAYQTRSQIREQVGEVTGKLKRVWPLLVLFLLVMSLIWFVRRKFRRSLGVADTNAPDSLLWNRDINDPDKLRRR